MVNLGRYIPCKHKLFGSSKVNSGILGAKHLGLLVVSTTMATDVPRLHCDRSLSQEIAEEVWAEDKS